MEVLQCYNCHDENSAASKFCKNCGVSLKCPSCASPIKANSKFCSECGYALQQNIANENRAVNRFEFQQKGSSKSISAVFTDDVGAFFTSTFNAIIGGHPATPKNPFHKAIAAPKKVDTPLGDMDSGIQDAEIVGDYSEIISKIFRQNENGKLEVVDNRFKEKSQNDKIKRLTVLFFYAKKLMGIELVSRDELNDIISQQKLNGGGFRKFLSKEALKFITGKENGTFSLLKGGEEEAERVLQEIADSDFKPSVSKAGRKSGRKSPKEGGKEKSGSASKPTAMEMCNELINTGYFATPRKLNDLVTYCIEKRATKYSPQNLTYALNRLVKNKVLDRDKNTEGQYEYHKK